LNTLHKEGKLELVSPSKDIQEAYLRKAQSQLESARILVDNGKLEEPVGHAYYCMYNASLALLFRVGIKCENHGATIILLNEVFGIDNTDISFAKEERVDKQYYITNLTVTDVRDLIGKAQRFKQKMIDFSTRINSDQVDTWRQLTKELIGQK
jgi:uncharacterized protein (UPF0332 family)